MSSPQLENGYTRLANEILEALALTDLNGTQRRILDVLLRQTYGFQRKEHDLSISFIAKATNIHYKQIQRELNNLINRQIVIVEAEATFNKSRKLKFNKNHKGWLNSGEVTNKLPLNELDTHTGNELSPPRGNDLVPQIKKKENIKDILMTPYEKEFVSVLENIKDYPLDIDKDLNYIKVLEERYPTLDLVEAIKKFSIWILDNPIKKNSNCRSQINNSFSKYVEWGTCIKQPIDSKKLERGPLKMVFKDVLGQG